MYGGVGGEESRGSPLSRFSPPSASSARLSGQGTAPKLIPDPVLQVASSALNSAAQRLRVELLSCVPSMFDSSGVKVPLTT
jgi:hypothetical protein